MVVGAAVDAVSLDQFVGGRVGPVVVRGLHLGELQRTRTNCSGQTTVRITVLLLHLHSLLRHI